MHPRVGVRLTVGAVSVLVQAAGAGEVTLLAVGIAVRHAPDGFTTETGAAGLISEDSTNRVELTLE